MPFPPLEAQEANILPTEKTKSPRSEPQNPSIPSYPGKLTPTHQPRNLIESLPWGQRHDSVVKSIGYSSKEPDFNSQHPLNSSPQSVTPVRGD